MESRKTRCDTFISEVAAIVFCEKAQQHILSSYQKECKKTKVSINVNVTDCNVLYIY